MLRYFLTLALLTNFFIISMGQEPGRKQLEALRISERPRIDGVLDEECWQNASQATDWVQYEPFNGKEPSEQSIVMTCYDDNSMYFAAILYDAEPDKIMKELGARDSDELNADRFAVMLSPYDDGFSAYSFSVYASGVQVDVKYYSGGDDESWDAVWKSAVNITESGWIVEIEIPYSAIRFSTKDDQVWGINFEREIRRLREISTWKFIDKNIEGIVNQEGLLANIHDIRPPIRLSFEPYIVSNLARDPDNTKWKYNFNGGVDLKLGLSESFTLDMTLVPDFSQVQSDDIIVNLSPFETYYSEKRQFFTEGVELFSKGDIFYSRRVGSRPINYDQVYDDYSAEDVIDNPTEARLYNATKISGRTSKGTGLGLFNAITAPAYATVRDSTGSEKDILTQPLSNYNMLVFDQSLPNKSYVSLYNTNVYRGRDEYTANVTGTEMNFRNKSNSFSAYGLLNVSQLYYPDTSADIGFFYDLAIEKVGGRTNYGLYQKMETDNYDPNDMGYNESNNEFSNGIFFNYHIYDPFWKILRMRNEINVQYQQLYAPREFTSLEIYLEHMTVFKNNLSVFMNGTISPVESRDYFEPRNEGWYVKYAPYYALSAFYSPDYNKTFLVDLSAGTHWFSQDGERGYFLKMAPRFKTNKHLFMVLSALYDRSFNNLGYVTDSTGPDGLKIIFGARDVENITTTLSVNYSINPKISLNLRLRYYYFNVGYNQFYDLHQDGSLTETDYSGDEDFLFNAFNIDAYFTWLFAPGSELVLAWKNAIYRDGELPAGGYFREFGSTLQSPASNLISLKILYYLDAQYFKRLKRNPDRE